MTGGVVIPLAAGTAFAAATIALLRWTGMDRDRATGPLMLVAIALFYPVFAVENGSRAEVAIHAGIALAFLGAAIIGHRRGLALVGIAMMAHGAFDLAAHVLTDGPAPRWWGPFCLGVDVVLGAWLLIARPWATISRERDREAGSAP
ncbi:hypothetical protein [uncultured Jannaschia sp.]|uniref:hypothetical protein n=1 Tax=Jannaschia halovivens TaxID=3388667 RepID=UPI002623B0BF|nr:hypothetical protein [uncultured Jannaschia sp.]